MQLVELGSFQPKGRQDLLLAVVTGRPETWGSWTSKEYFTNFDTGRRNYIFIELSPFGDMQAVVTLTSYITVLKFREDCLVS
jgi:hypothetical protein